MAAKAALPVQIFGRRFGQLRAAVTAQNVSALRLASQRLYTTEKQPEEATGQTAEQKAPAGAASPEVEKLTKDLAAAKEQNAELLDKYKRALADSENMRNRLNKQISDAKIFGIQSFCKDLLEVADTLGHATQAVPKEKLSGNADLKNLYEGLSMTRRKKAPTENVAKKRKAQGNQDDAPRAFKRLMAFASGKKYRSGLDDGTKQPKRKAANSTSSTTAPAPPAQTNEAANELPTIRPGEKLSDFAARVDQALPLSGLVTKTVKDGKDVTGLKVRRTTKERKMHKLYDQWREEDRKIKERREEAMEEETERQIDEDLANGTWRDWTKDYSKDVIREAEATDKKKPKKKKKTKKQKEEDPWKEFEKKHAEPRRGLHDVVKAPPELRGPGNKLKLRDN